MKQAYLSLSYTKYVGFFQDHAAEKFSRSDVQVWPSFLSVEVNGHEAWHVIWRDWKHGCPYTRNYRRWRFGQAVEWWQNCFSIYIDGDPNSSNQSLWNLDHSMLFRALFLPDCCLGLSNGNAGRACGNELNHWAISLGFSHLDPFGHSGVYNQGAVERVRSSEKSRLAWQLETLPHLCCTWQGGGGGGDAGSGSG